MITPIYLEEAGYPVDLRSEIANEKFTTHFYLPLEKLKGYDTEKFIEKCNAKLNSNLVLFCQKLNKIEISNQANSFTYSKKITNTELLTNGITKTSLEVTVTASDANTQQDQYELFEIEEEVPKRIASEEKLSTISMLTKITLAFPLNAQNAITYPVYSFLPLSDEGFKFIINCYWILTTNRESINDRSSLNEFLLRKITALFVDIFTNEEFLNKDSKKSYFPKPCERMSSWWLQFIKNIKEEVKINRQKQILTGTKKNERVFNTELVELINPDDLSVLNEHSDYHIYSADDIYAEFLEYPKFTIIDIIDILAQINESSSQLHNWKIGRSDKWWVSLFECINNLGVEDNPGLAEKLKGLQIYLVWNEGQIKDSSSVRSNSLSGDGDELIFFKVRDQSSRNKYESFWKSNIKLINYNSKSEFKFLTRIMKFEVFDEVPDTIDLILIRHQLDVCQTSELVWRELEFIKNNFDEFERIISKDAKNRELLKVPVSSAQLAPFKFTHLPSLLNYDLTDLALSFQQEEKVLFIDFKEFSENMTTFEILNWEFFFLSVGCKIPKLEAGQCFKRLFDFSVYNTSEIINLSIRLFDLVKEMDLSFVDALSKLPIKAKSESKTDVKTMPMAEVYGEKSDTHYYVLLEKEKYGLAKRFQVKFNCQDDDRQSTLNNEARHLEDSDRSNTELTQKIHEISSQKRMGLNRSSLENSQNYRTNFSNFTLERNPVSFTEFSSHETPITDEEIKLIGKNAEIYFNDFLKHHYPDTSNFEWSSQESESLGYDFDLDDWKNVLKLNQKQGEKFFIEVKGLKTEMTKSSVFYISENEKSRSDSCIHDSKRRYVVVIIQNVIDSVNTNVARIVDWSSTDIIGLKSCNFKAWLKKTTDSCSSVPNNNNKRTSCQTNQETDSPGNFNNRYRKRPDNTPKKCDTDDDWRKKTNNTN